MSRPVRALVAISLLALLHAAIYVMHEMPEWDTTWTDQRGYAVLGRALATTGRFTHYPEAPTFIPESVRTPVYPLFLALVYRTLGTDHLAVAAAQAVLFAALCLVVYAMARPLTSQGTALAAATVTALYAPLPFYGALVLTELWTTFMLTIALWLSLRAAARSTTARLLAAGIALGFTALSRPVFVLLPFALAAAAIVLFPRPAAGERRRWLLLAGAALLTLSPWLAYNYVHFHRLTMSPAGGIGRGLWEGSWNGRWPGRVQAAITRAAERPTSDAGLEHELRALATEVGHDAAPMLEYARQWRDIRRIWTEPTDLAARPRARVEADAEYLRTALANIRRDPLGHAWRRFTRGTFLLWAGEVPLRHDVIERLPWSVIRAVWAVQALIVALGVLGAIVLARGGQLRAAIVLAAPLVYITAVHVPLLTEARQSLPAKPALLVLATIGSAVLVGRAHRHVVTGRAG